MEDQRSFVKGRAARMVGLAKDVVNAKKPDFDTSHDPRVKSVIGGGMGMSRKRVELVPVHDCKDKE